MANVPFKRSDWNEIIQQVNEILQNPPADTDCNPKPTIDEVGPNHIWTFGDIEEVQNALKSTCEDIEFDEIPELWKQSIIDEINDAMGQAWCDCEPDEGDCDPEDEEAAQALHGTEFVIYNNGPIRVTSNCLGNEVEPIPLCDLIHGMQIGIPNVSGMFWTLKRVNYRQGGGVFSTPLDSGLVDCIDGTVICTESDVLVQGEAGIHVFCPTCNDFCFEVIGDAEAQLGNPDLFYSEYILVIDSDDAFCDPCCDAGDPPNELGQQTVFFEIVPGPFNEEFTPLADLINGMSIAEPGWGGRFWRYFQILNLDGNIFTSDTIAEGAINCDGTVFYEGSQEEFTGQLGEDASGQYILEIVGEGAPHCCDPSEED